MNFKHRTEHGQALVLIAIGLLALITITALAIDAGNAFSDRRQAQNAADTAALAAALEKIQDTPSSDGDGLTWSSAGLARASSNGYTNDIEHSTVTINNPPSANDCNPNDTPSPYVNIVDKNDYIQVIINSIVDTYFGPIIGINQTHSCVEAIARAKPEYTAPLFGGNAVVALATSGCALTMQGNTDITININGIFSNADVCNSSGSIDLTSPYLQLVGVPSFNPNSDIYTNITSGVSPYTFDDIIWPSVSCAGDAGYVDFPDGDPKTVELTPGTVSGDFPPNLGVGIKVVSLQSGIYCISGNIDLNGDIKGNNVLLYAPDGSFSSNGNAENELTAMTSGNYAGLLIYAPLANQSNFTMNGGSDSSYFGTILAPGANCTINGNSGTFALSSQVICNTITFSGSGVINITYNDAQNFDVSHPPSIEITK